MITKRSKGYVPYLYTQRKYKIITAYMNSKTGGGDKIIVSKRTLHSKKYSQRINKQRQTIKNEIKEKSYLDYTTIIKYAFCFLTFLFCIR